MNLKNIIGPAFSSFLIVCFLAVGMQWIQEKKIPVSNNLAQQDLSVSPVVTLAATQALATVQPTQKAAVSAVPTAKPTTQPTAKPTAKPPVTCIITVNGSRYNVQALKTSHSGGNVFVCGTDMTSVFKSQHGSNWSLISKYKI